LADHPNVARCRRAYQLFNAGDAEAIRGLLSEDIAWHVPGRGKFAGTKHGHDEVFAFLGQVGWEQGQTTFDIDLREVVADDKHMVAVVHYHHERADAVFDQDGVEVFSLGPDGKITAFWAFVHDSAAFDEFFG
jgi:uncharacterized protein